LEKGAKEEASKAQVEAEARNKEMVKKVEDSDRKVDQLQELVQRLVQFEEKKKIYIVMYEHLFHSLKLFQKNG